MEMACARTSTETTRNLNNSSLNNRNISVVGGQHGRGGGGSSSGRGFQGKGRGACGRGEHGRRIKKKPWVQALVDKCTDITELSYPPDVYKKFGKNQRQRVFQNRQGRPKTANAISPPSSIALSKLSSTVSVLQETIATQGRLLAENDRLRQGTLNDPVGADMNRDINRTGSTRGRNERAPVGDRE